MSTRDRRCVVAAVDGRPGGEAALRYAVDEAVRHGDCLHLLHVWPGCPPRDLVPVVAWSELQAAGRAVLDAASVSALRIAPGLEITTDLIVGPRSAGILTGSRGGRLAVVGRSRRHRVDVPFGGTAAAVAARAECPVVVVPSSWGGGVGTGVGTGRVVVAMKSRRHAAELLSHAFDIAQERAAGIVVITAWELYDPTMDRHEATGREADWEAEGTAVLESLVESWRALPHRSRRPSRRPRARRHGPGEGVGRCRPPSDRSPPARRAAVRAPRRDCPHPAAAEPVPRGAGARRRRRRRTGVASGLTSVPGRRGLKPLP
jgi:nucleotide-binding universal stress UspA family protein